jgi:hypothetical protein
MVASAKLRDAIAAALRHALPQGSAVDSKGEARKPSDRTTLFDWRPFKRRNLSALHRLRG